MNTDAGPQAVAGRARTAQLDIMRRAATVEPIGRAELRRFEKVAAFYAEQKVTEKKVDIARHVLDVRKLK
ncbi:MULTISPECIES: hypothetical protein [unclassified Streptomyces]|uniref:hypothetical protein n=1 Tax=unclassified Streptomyces TaxID=2593676 RepID=UPI00278C1C54|nr:MULTISPECIES: hypothetical protein [unclassified Streptomyces]